MEIITLKVKDLKPYDKNAKQHPQNQIDKIKKSIQEFGFNDPIAVDESNVIIEGNGRFEAIKQLGFKEVQCIRLENLTEEKKRAYILVHNKLTMDTGFDFDMLQSELEALLELDVDMSEFDFDITDVLEDEPKEVKEDDFDADKALEEVTQPTVKRGEVWKLGNLETII